MTRGGEHGPSFSAALAKRAPGPEVTQRQRPGGAAEGGAAACDRQRATSRRAQQCEREAGVLPSRRKQQT